MRVSILQTRLQAMQNSKAYPYCSIKLRRAQEGHDWISAYAPSLNQDHQDHEGDNKDHSAESLRGVYFSMSTRDLCLSTIQIDVEPEQTVGDLKNKIQEGHGHAITNQKIIYSGACFSR